MERKFNAVSAALGILTLCIAIPVFAQNPGLTFVEDQPQADAGFSVPDRIVLSGIVVDQFGSPVVGARIRVNGRDRGVVSDASGAFSWPREVPPDAQVEISHADTQTLVRSAASFYVADHAEIASDSGVNVTITRFVERFIIGPDGGRFPGKTMTIDVPAGAVAKAVTIRAAVLPTDQAYDSSNGLQPVPLAAVVFDPPGLQFFAPITVTLPQTEARERFGWQPLRFFDRRTGRYVDDPDGRVKASADSVDMMISHFSRYSAGSPSQGMSRRMVRRTSDLNGDGKITAQDAVFVVILSGGTHTAQWQQEVEAGSVVMSTVQVGSGTSSGKSTSLSGGASYGPVSVEVTSTVSSETASEVLRTSGLSAGTTRTTEMQRTLDVGEYDTRCRYVLFIYEYWRVRTWQSIAPSESEMKGIRDAYDQAQNRDDNGYGYFHIVGGSGIAVGRTLHDGMHIAVREENGELKVYVRGNEYLVRVPKGLRTLDCDSDDNMGENLQGMLARDGADDLQFFGAGDGLDEAVVSEQTAKATSVRYGGWGVLEQTTPEFHLGLECGEEESGSVTVSSELETMSEQAHSSMSSESREIAGSVSVSVPLPGGFGASGGAGQSASTSSTRSTAHTYGQQMTSRVTTSVGWTIHNAHTEHVSDHAIYKLHLIYTTRDWQLIDPDRLPDDLKNSPAMQSDSGYRYGQAGDQLFMRAADGSWYIAGQAVTTQKEIGFLLLRISEKPCGEPVETPSPAPTPDTRPPVITPGPGEYHPQNEQRKSDTGRSRETATPDQTQRADTGGVQSRTWLQQDQAAAPGRSTVTVEVMGLDDRTVVNRNYIGSIQTVRVLAIDGKEQQPDEAGVDVTVDSDRIMTRVAEDSRIARIALIGTAGIIDLVRTSTTASHPKPGGDRSLATAPRVSDGEMEISGGAVDETILLPSGAIDMNAAPQDHVVTIGDAALDPVVIRPNEIAIVGSNVAPAANPTIHITNPNGKTLSGELNGWGWRVGVDREITRINQTVNVLVQVNGLKRGEWVEMNFIPGPGQRIEPATIQIQSGQAEQPVPMAIFTATIMGTNLFDVSTVRHSARSDDPTDP